MSSVSDSGGGERSAAKGGGATVWTRSVGCGIGDV
jgi:hypothetical protein